jgi:pimeloyl-ACP methyl ester carboxylesterase
MAHRGFWRLQRPLASDFRLISIDLRGQGESVRAGDSPGVEQLAEDVTGLVEELGLEDAIGVGWSLGASVLWHVLTGPAAARFSGSVIIDMTPKVQNGEDWQLGLSQDLCEARRLGIREEFEAFAANAGRAMFAEPTGAAARMAQWAAGEFAGSDQPSIAALWESLVEQDLRPLLPRIAQPALIVHGAQSQLYGSGTAEYLARALPNARCIRFDRSGHAPHLEQPELFNTAIRDFAASLPRTRQTQASHSTH